MPDLVLRPGALRLLLAINVMALHYSQQFKSPLYAPIDAASVYGFFFLSGYWVKRLWDEKYSRCASRLSTFYISRAWRVYPLAIVSTLLAYAIIFPTTGPIWDRLILSIAVIYAYEVGQPINAAAWSLAIELQFYAVAPFLFLALRSRVATVTILAAGSIMWAVFVLGVRPFGIEVTLASFVALFVLGALYNDYPLHRHARRLAPYSLVAVVALGLLTSVPAIRSFLPPITSTSALRLFATVLGLVALPYVAASLSKTSGHWDRVLGDLSYPVFLFHLPALSIALYAFQQPQGPLFAIAATVVLSLAAYLVIDRPSESLRQAFVRQRAATSAVAVAAPAS